MEPLHYQNQTLHIERVALEKIAQAYGTPTYVYSKNLLVEKCRQFLQAYEGYPTLPCYAVKANSNLSVLKLIFSEGFGAEVVSVGEMYRALKAGASPNTILFSGVGKRDDEIQQALKVGVLAINAESETEVQRICQIAQQQQTTARLVLRINPDIDARTNPHIATGLYSTKFGLAEEDARKLISSLLGRTDVSLVGISCHIGSQITELEPFEQASKRMASLAREVLRDGHRLEFVDLGGGLGIRYREEAPPSFSQYAEILLRPVRELGLKLLLEPGRALVGNAGILLTRVVSTKRTPKKNFVILDAGMNDLIRPCLYEAYHAIEPVEQRAEGALEEADVVGPICETTDTFGHSRKFPVLRVGELMVIRETGAYGASMASQYNGRPRAAEVMVDGEDFRLIRERESLDDLWAKEIRFL